jgi:hypothetical protein
VKAIILIATTLASLAGCSRDEHAVTKVEQHLTVAGPQDGMDRFVKLQHSRRPSLEVSAFRPVGNGHVEATLTIPATYTGLELVHTTREALAAGLDYQYDGHRSVLQRS